MLQPGAPQAALHAPCAPCRDSLGSDEQQGAVASADKTQGPPAIEKMQRCNQARSGRFCMGAVHHSGAAWALTSARALLSRAERPGRVVHSRRQETGGLRDSAALRAHSRAAGRAAPAVCRPARWRKRQAHTLQGTHVSWTCRMQAGQVAPARVRRSGHKGQRSPARTQQGPRPSLRCVQAG